MSKGNMFMGYAKGKVGSVVFARAKNQQITRSYNDSPKNPRSDKQMMQRAIFCSAVKFFSQGKENFFQFAFENKKATCSDYNAFMAENAKRGQYISQAAYNEDTYPVLSPFMMTKGTLAEPDLELNTAGTAFTLALTGITTSSKWGDVSAKLISLYGYSDGDIVTITTIKAAGSTSGNCPNVSPEKQGRISWTIKQGIINSESTDLVADVFDSTVSVAADALTVTPTDMANVIIGCNLTVTRQTTDGLKVANSYLVLNTSANTVYQNALEESYISKVLTSWGATGSAILQGSLVQ